MQYNENNYINSKALLMNICTDRWIARYLTDSPKCFLSTFVGQPYIFRVVFLHETIVEAVMLTHGTEDICKGCCSHNLDKTIIPHVIKAIKDQDRRLRPPKSKTFHTFLSPLLRLLNL